MTNRDPVQELLARLSGVKKSRDGWMARCPAHDDKNPSLSVKRGDDGQAVVHCFAGCTPDAIVSAIGWQLADLFPSNDGSSPAPRRKVGSERKPTRTYATPDDVVDSLLQTPELHGGKVTRHNYTESFIVLRFDLPGGKSFRPIHRTDSGWVIGDPPGKLPLYRVAELPPDGPVSIVEGEKDCDAAWSLGLPTVTSAHGSKAADKTGWAQLAGRDVVILPDNDDAGQHYADTVAGILHALGCKVKIVVLPGLPKGGGIANFIADRDSRDDDDLRRMVEAIADETPSWQPAQAGDETVAETEGLLPVPAFDPELLPREIRDWIVDISERAQCPAEYPAVGAMIALASVVGRKVAIRPKRRDDWQVTPNLWGGIIGPPGVLKTPALREALKPLVRLEVEAKKVYDRRVAQFLVDEDVATATKKEAKQAMAAAIREGDDPTAIAKKLHRDEPTPPVRRRYLTNDPTVEKLGALLNENPNGLLVFRDELVGLLRALDKKGQECARSFYLEAWNGDGRFTFDRIGRGTVDIESVCVSLVGGIQPGPFRSYLLRAMEGGTLDDGLVQRFQLLVWPDVPQEWTNVDRWPDSEAKRRAFNVFQHLDGLDPVTLDGSDRDDEGRVFLRFTDDAQRRFDAWRAGLESRLRSRTEAAAFEAVDHDGPYGVAKDVGRRAEHVEERIHRKDDRDVVNRQMHRSGDKHHGDQARVGDGRGTDRGHHRRDENQEGDAGDEYDADVVQAAGCIPLDVRAMGIDFCSASTYKWLMGLRGMGLFYVREELQGDVLKPMMYGDKQYAGFEYHYFPGSPPGDEGISLTERSGGAMYEVGNVASIAGPAQEQALKYILKLGVDNILAHAKPLCDRLIEELPRLGYPSITPPGSPTPIAAFLVDNPEETRAKLKKANVVAKVKWRQMRISPSVFNTDEDIERLLDALS